MGKEITDEKSKAEPLCSPVSPYRAILDWTWISAVRSRI